MPVNGPFDLVVMALANIFPTLVVPECPAGVESPDIQYSLSAY
jgi:hypothetical protein